MDHNDMDDPTVAGDTLIGEANTIYSPVVRPWKADKAPNIEDRFFKSVVPVQNTPSDRVAFYTYVMALGDQPVRIADRQPEGIACRVRVHNISGTSGNDIALVNDPSMAGVIVASGSVQVLQNGFILRSFSTPSAPFELLTKHELWAVPLSGAAIVVTVCVETYDLW